MTERIHFEIRGLRFVTYPFCEPCIEYTEYSPAHGYSNSETSVDISREDAIRIVEFFRSQYGIE